MSKQFNGKINVDVRDSTPDWKPYEAPKAPDGAPNGLYIVWDDVGFGAFEIYGGLIKVPNMKRIADRTNLHTVPHNSVMFPYSILLTNGS